jgi:hypothetical protein
MDEVRERLTRGGQKFGRATDAQKRAREELGDLIRDAYANNVGPAEITRLIGHRLTEKTVIRIAKGES